MSIFQDVLVRKPGRSMFNLTHEKKFSANWSTLYPVCVMEAVPGDTFRINTEVFIRTAPMIAPVMHRVDVKMNYFFCPNRLNWSNWEDFITGVNQDVAYDPIEPDEYFTTEIPPYFRINSGNLTTINDNKFFVDGSLADFLGFPTVRPWQSVQVSPDINVQLLPFLAYQRIYNDWFRNQNVESPINLPDTSGAVTSGASNLFTLRKRMWEKDYFTSALPFAQRGDAVNIPIADISYNAYGGRTFVKLQDGTMLQPNGRNYELSANNNRDSSQTDIVSRDNNNVPQQVNIDNSANLKVNAGTINDLRIATRLQRWLEINSRVGGRYIEQILGHFGVKSSDARLQRVEYLGGWSCPIIVEPIDQTSATLGTSQGADDDWATPQGNMAGKGTAYSKGKSIKVFCEEHGFVFGILSIMPKTSYQDGLPKMFQRNYKEDYYFPEFANLGEQEVNQAEVYFNLANQNQRSFNRFGFQERFCEYKYIPSTVHGEFKNNLQFWHLGRSFDSQPVLNKSFVECQPRTNIFAVEEDVNHFYVNLINHVKALRPMPKQSIPTL